MADWFVIRSKPHKEEFLKGQLIARQVEVYYPRIKVNAASLRARKLKPYFPGYLFVQLDMEQINLSSFKWLPGAAGLVMFGGIPPIVPAELIMAIKRHIVELDQADEELYNGLKHGDAVIVDGGPFAGYSAIFDTHLSGNERVRILLKMLSDRQMTVDLPINQIHRKNR